MVEGQCRYPRSHSQSMSQQLPHSWAWCVRKALLSASCLACIGLQHKLQSIAVFKTCGPAAAASANPVPSSRKAFCCLPLLQM